MRCLCSDQFNSWRQAVDGEPLSLNHCEAFCSWSVRPFCVMHRFKHSIYTLQPFTRFSFHKCLIIYSSIMIVNVILLKLFLLHVSIILCQFMCVWVKTGSPCLCAFIIIYTPNTSSHGKPGSAVDLPSEHTGCICPCPHYQDQMTMINCCLLMFQTALCQKKRGCLLFFLKIDKPLSDIRDAIFRAYLFNSTILPVKIKKQKNGMYF